MLLPQKDNYLVAVHLQQMKNKIVMAKTITAVKCVFNSIIAIHRNMLKQKPNMLQTTKLKYHIVKHLFVSFLFCILRFYNKNINSV